MSNGTDTHRKTIGYILWIFGFTGSHRFISFVLSRS
jgi:TM2 domain-containing membrane protein YozV